MGAVLGVLPAIVGGLGAVSSIMGMSKGGGESAGPVPVAPDTTTTDEAAAREEEKRRLIAAEANSTNKTTGLGMTDEADLWSNNLG